LDQAFNTRRHPRSAIGVGKKRTSIYGGWVDGRHEQAEGVSIKELQDIMRWVAGGRRVESGRRGGLPLYVFAKNNRMP